MSLKDCALLFLDAQTTGMRPPGAHLIELGWSLTSAAEPHPTIQAHCLRLPEGVTLPRKVSEITGINATDLETGREREQVASLLSQDLARLETPVAVIHYAQFEWPFLVDLLGPTQLNSLCTQAMTKRLFPDIPSTNIRAAAGFFGPAILGPNRVEAHVRATLQIWRGLVAELEKKGLNSLAEVMQWLASSKEKRGKQKAFDYRLDRLKRLRLPDRPGIYRMLDRSGQVLYVGKATSLKDRVNSYFRGQKNLEAHKRALIAQVWDLIVTECETPLEAALLESDEIKRLDPPYNILLKRGRRHLLFYDREFVSSERQQSLSHPIGPFRPNGWIETLRLLASSLAGPEFKQIFFHPLPEEDLRAGFDLLCQRLNLEPQLLSRTRPLLALGLWLYRKHGEPTASPSRDEEKTVTIEDIADKFERLLRRAGAERTRGRKMTRLLSGQIRLADGRELSFTGGQLTGLASEVQSGHTGLLPWSGLDIDTFDRMSIVLSELLRAPTP